MERQEPAPRRGHITQKAKIGQYRTLYLSVDSETPTELFLRIKGGSADAEKVVAYDVAARLISLALQYGVPMEAIAERLIGAKDNTGGIVRGDTQIKMCDGTFDYVGKHLLVFYGGRDDLAHVQHDTIPADVADGSSADTEQSQDDQPIQ